MKTLKDAIELIMSEPPEPHYPAYYADLLKKADVPDKDVGKCSESPNSSETIYRQAAITQLSHNKNKGDDEWELAVENDIQTIWNLPPAQPKNSMLTVTVAPDPEDIERAVRKIHDAPVTVLPPAQPEIIRCGDCKYFKVEYGWNCASYPVCEVSPQRIIKPDDYCSFAERRPDEQ